MLKLGPIFSCVIFTLIIAGIPMIVLLTKIDQACNYVASDVSLVYKSTAIRDLMALVRIAGCDSYNHVN